MNASRHSQSIIGGPSRANSASQGGILHHAARISAPFGERFRLSEASKPNAASGVQLLSRGGNEAAIGRFIAPIDINAFYRQISPVASADGPVFERGERVCPFFADLDPPSAIVAKVAVIRVMAASLDSTPEGVKWRFGTSRRLAVAKVSGNRRPPRLAAARSRIAINDILENGFELSATLAAEATSAKPMAMFIETKQPGLHNSAESENLAWCEIKQTCSGHWHPLLTSSAYWVSFPSRRQ